MGWDHPGIAATAQNLDTYTLYRRVLPGQIHVFDRRLHDRLSVEAQSAVTTAPTRYRRNQG
jgi:hypothetical protein